MTSDERAARGDGGGGESPSASTEQRDPADDPRACSFCGVHIGAFSGDYCEGCERELGMKPPIRRCEGCGSRYPEEQMEALDVSGEGEYYPEFIYLCRGCVDGE